MGELRQRGRIWWIQYFATFGRHEKRANREKGKARDLLRLREGDVSKGVPVSPAIGRLRFDDAVKDVITDYTVNRRDSLAHVERRVKSISRHGSVVGAWPRLRRRTAGLVAERLKAGASGASIENWRS